MKKLILPFLFLCFFISGYSQSDTLYTKSHKKITCKIVEINETQVKYRLAAAMDGPVYVVDKETVLKYTLASGFSELLLPDEMSIEHEHGNILANRSVIKINPFSFVNSQISLAYEKVIKVGFNLDVEVGYINNSINYKSPLITDNSFSTIKASGGFEPARYSGAYIKPGVKFFLGQDFSVKGLKYAHPLKGRYIKLDLAVSYINFQNVQQSQYYGYYYYPNGYNTTGTISSTNVNTIAYGGFVNYGRQFILGNILTLEYYIGIGFTGRSTTLSNPDYLKSGGYGNVDVNNIFSATNYHGFVRTSNVGLSGTAGFRIGYIIPAKKAKAAAAQSK